MSNVSIVDWEKLSLNNLDRVGLEMMNGDRVFGVFVGSSSSYIKVAATNYPGVIEIPKDTIRRLLVVI